MNEEFSAIVVGGGIVGAATLFHLTDLGRKKPLLIERGAIASGGTGKSCSIVRTHYSIASNTKLAVHSLGMFRDFKTALDDPQAESGFVPSGYLILARGDTATNLIENLDVQKRNGANTEAITPEEARALNPLVDYSDTTAIGWEPESGYADPHLSTTSFINAARRRGAVIRPNTAVDELIIEGDRVVGVRTRDGDIFAETVISAIGPWTRSLTDPLGIDIPMVNYRHTVMTLRAETPYARELPIIKDLTVDNKMYFRPESGMILVGTGDYGTPCDDPDDMNAKADEDLVVTQLRQVAHRVPAFADAEVTGTWFGPYDINPDWNPVLDKAPGIEGLYLAFGFSGHGFKLAPAVGLVLAQLALDLMPTIDIDPYRLSRFAEGAELTGTYGSGSIS